MAGRVDKLYVETAESEPRFFRVNGNAAVFFYLVSIEKCVSMVDASGMFYRAGCEKKGFRQCRLAGVDVGQYSKG